MDIRKFFKKTPSDSVTSPDVSASGEGQQSEQEPAASGSAEPDPGSSRVEATPCSASWSSASVTGPQLPVGCVPVSDLGTDKPKQVILKTYPVKMFGSRKRSFSSSWYLNRDWLEYSVERDAAFCYACRKYKSASDATFSSKGFSDWKHALETGKGLNKHATSKEHLVCETMWRDSEKRRETGKEISTLLNSEQLSRNRYYMSAIIDMMEFLVVNQLPLRGDNAGFASVLEDSGSMGLFLSLFEYSMRKDPELNRITKTIPQNARYTSPQIQNEIIEMMSKLVTEEIVRQVGDSWYSIKVDGTRDPIGQENISIVVRFVDENYAVCERLLVMATSEKGDAEAVTGVIIDELTSAGLSTDKILSQVYDGASLMSGKHGGVQKLLQNKLDRNIPYIHCFKHQLHLVVVHAMSSEAAVQNFFGVCNMLYNFIRKPTVAMLYKGETLKRLLDQRWTGHLATVKVVVKSFHDIFTLLTEVENTGGFGAEVRVGATGLRRAITQRGFLFIAHLVMKLLSLFEPPNRLLQAEDMDLFTAVTLVNSASDCVKKMRTENEFSALWDFCASSATATEPVPVTGPGPSKRRRTVNKNLCGFAVEETVGQPQSDTDEKTEFKRLFYSVTDAVQGEMDARFGERSSALIGALAALNPEAEDNFLDPSKITPLLELVGADVVESEYTVAREFLVRKMTDTPVPPEDGKWTIANILSTFNSALQAMSTVVRAYKLALTLGASTAACENSFSTLKSVFSEHRRSMLHKRKAQLIQLGFEKDLTHRFKSEWKDALMRRFSLDKRRLPLY